VRKSGYSAAAIALERELAEQSRLWNTAGSREGIAASLERRVPVFEGI
jgi:2-(1,2-epoxy-1,2-dihydrophenyl)acetyl-CoA isomerase